MVKILILGGGFGGVRVALDLEKKFRDEIKKGEAQITLIDKNSYHLFASALYEVASAASVKKDPFSTILKKTVCIPYADIFEGKAIQFIEAEAAEVNLNNKFIKTKGGQQHDFDYLVLALGAQSSDFGIPGVKEYAYKFKTLEDGLILNDRIESMINDMANGRRALPINILVGGAGFTGIEVAAELACTVKKIANKCGLKGKCSSIILFEAGPKILPMASDKERAVILKRLTKHGIVVMENSMIEEVGNDFVKLKTGQKINGDLVVWTAGIKPSELIGSISGLPLTEKGKIPVGGTLLVNGLNNIFAIGDNMEFIDPATKRPVPAMALPAYKSGAVVAQNIFRSVRNKKLKEYIPSYDAWVAPVGGKYAVAHVGKITISGFWGWAIREAVDLRYMLQILPLFKAFSIFWEEITLFTKND